jgi:hypothetical protein
MIRDRILGVYLSLGVGYAIVLWGDVGIGRIVGWGKEQQSS